LKEETRTMTAFRQKLGLRPDTPTRPSKLEGRANNPGQKENSTIRKIMKQCGGKRLGASEERTTPPPLFFPRRKPRGRQQQKPDHGTHPGKGQRGENKAGRGNLSRQGEGNPALLGDEDLGTGDLKN
jgi:hypothetical protein